jgi:hypothetical protein
MTTHEAYTPDSSKEPPNPTTETLSPQATPTAEAPSPQATPTAEAPNPQGDTTPPLAAQQPQASQELEPPPFPEHLHAEFEEFSRKTDALLKYFDDMLAPHRELLEAMAKEKKQYEAWKKANPHPVLSFQDLERYASSLYMSKVEMRETSDMGRGVFTVAPLKKGDLFLAEEAFVAPPTADDPFIISLLGIFANPWALTKELLKMEPERQAIAAQLHNAHTDKSAHLLEQLAQIQEASPETFPEGSLETLAHWIGIMQSNGFCFQIHQRKRVGLYPLAAILNHSCEPNVTFSYEGTTIIFHAKTDLPEDTQLFHSYLGGSTLPVAQRRQMLQERFNFICCCPKCTTEAASASA